MKFLFFALILDASTVPAPDAPVDPKAPPMRIIDTISTDVVGLGACVHAARSLAVLLQGTNGVVKYACVPAEVATLEVPRPAPKKAPEIPKGPSA